MQFNIAQTTKGPIEYRFDGDGPVIVVLYGGHCSRHTRLSHERLATVGYSVLTPSRPGYDQTPSSVGPTAEEAADAIAALLDTLNIATVTMIGISAAGPTALAFAQRHPDRTRKLILESAVATEWDEQIKRGARILFGRAEKFTWAMTRTALRLFPSLTIKSLVKELTILDIAEVMKRMSPDDLAFIKHMIRTFQSGTGFMNDIEHTVNDLTGITAPALVMYSPNDKSVPPRNAKRVAAEVAACELYEVPSDTHLIWIGRYANDVWQKRLSFLRS
jgi:pimeloyl-ACP methyl ester carboxylesterase